MTTKLLQHPINPLTTLPFTIHHQKPAPPRQPSMDRKLESRSVESMRKMMVMQEQVFKHQVEELHRLYNLQKKLMKEIENGLKTRKEITALAERTINSITKGNHREVSGSSSVESSKMLINFDLKSTTSSIHEQKASNKAEDEADVEVDLTLSIGHSTRKVQRSQLQEIGSSSGKEDSSSGVYQENTRPRWLMQDLSLNRT